ncbi:GPP34 family phosphoprotein [Nonomuraea jabiensis]|uniref:GPP34 family phosphoprotein n=1 Tax=Nonomuraea jabiensis TaxID=882448 RepID=UPI0036C6F360
MSVTIAEELLLLAYNDEKGTQLVSGTQLDPALAGALLAELAVNGRLELSDKKVTVKDPSPLGDSELDATLARITEEGKERKPDDHRGDRRRDDHRHRMSRVSCRCR